MKIAVLLGGTSAERDVSFSTGIAIAKALKENGHEVQAIDCAYGDKTCDFENLNTADIIRTTPSDIEKESGYARIDLRFQENSYFFCLEVNTLPGMTPTSLLPKAAKAVGISFNELVKQIVKLALK